MVANYSDITKLKHAKSIAKEGGCFIVERGDIDAKQFLLYRECLPRNLFIGRRSKIDGILALVKKVCV